MSDPRLDTQMLERVLALTDLVGEIAEIHDEFVEAEGREGTGTAPDPQFLALDLASAIADASAVARAVRGEIERGPSG
jgi:hypothetical protein